VLADRLWTLHHQVSVGVFAGSVFVAEEVDLLVVRHPLENLVVEDLSQPLLEHEGHLLQLLVDEESGAVGLVEVLDVAEEEQLLVHQALLLLEVHQRLLLYFAFVLDLVDQRQAICLVFILRLVYLAVLLPKVGRVLVVHKRVVVEGILILMILFLYLTSIWTRIKLFSLLVMCLRIAIHVL